MYTVKLFFWLLCASNSFHVIAQQKSHATNFNWNTIPAHPFLFADDNRVATVQLQNDAVTNQLRFIIQQNADKLLYASKIIYSNSASNFATSRTVQERIICLALAYRLFHDTRYLTKAKEELLQLVAIKDWGTGHFLSVGEASLAVGIGYDWMYNYLSMDEKKIIVKAIKEKALLPGLAYKEGKDSWVNGNFNWNPVCHGGLMVAALAIAKEEPEITKQIVERAVKNIPFAGDAYSLDGAFAEGPSYWSYGTSFYVLAVEALHTAFGSSAGLEMIDGFLKTADYKIQMKGATGLDFNYSDYHIENLNEPILFWFANKLKRSDLVKQEIQDLAVLYEQWQPQKTGIVKRRVEQNRHTPLALLWWNPQLLATENYIAPALQWTADGHMSIAVMRSSFENVNASFVAMKGGTPNNSHGHMDAGSFILETNGVRWAVDLGTENYDKMRAAKIDLWNYEQNSSRWSTFRVGPEAHNIIRFDNALQQTAGNGKIKQLQLANGEMGAMADLTSLYSSNLSKVNRTILLHQNQSFSIQDEWVAKDTAVTYSFQWLTYAKVTKTGEGFLLEQDGALLKLKLVTPVLSKDIELKIEDVSQPKNIQYSPNPGISRIIIKIHTGASATGKLLMKAFS